jgi:hypothetical protein
MKRIVLLMALVAAALTSGCDEKAGGGAPPSTSAAATLKDEDLATPADFDDEAEKSITASNYKAEVDALEKEIDAP